MSLKPVAEIRDPVHGYVKVTEVERELIDSEYLQRLRRIHQLAGAYLVYPGAVHTRFEHVLGAMHVAGSMADSLSKRAELDSDRVQQLRLAALLHDVGHGPFSHMFEEVLGKRGRVSHEDISQRLITGTSIKDVLGKHGYSARSVAALAVGRQARQPAFMNELVSGGLSADIMDYLLRDSYFTGVEYGQVDTQRVIDSLYVHRDRLALDRAGLDAFEALILARYEMFKAVYFHRTVRAAELMLVRSMVTADGALHLTDLSPRRFLELTDEAVLQRLVSLRGTDPALREARRLAEDFRRRALVKCVYEEFVHRRGRGDQVLADSVFMARALEEIAAAAGVDVSHVYLDVPTTPSLPYTPSKEVVTSIMLTEERRGARTFRRTPLDSLPLIRSISGFMDVVRVYTRREDRERVEKVASSVLAGVAGEAARRGRLR